MFKCSPFFTTNDRFTFAGPAALFIGFIFLLGFFSPRALPYVMSLAGLVSAGVFFLKYRPGSCPAFFKSLPKQTLALLAFMLWAGLTLFWADNPELSAERFGKIILVIPFCWAAVFFTKFHWQDRAHFIVTACFLGMSGLIASELLLGFPVTNAIHTEPNKEPIYYLNKNAVILCLSAWPIAWLCWQKGAKMLSIIAAAAAIILISVMESQAAQLAALTFFVSALVSPLLSRSWLQKTFFVLLFAVMVASPFAAISAYEWAAVNLQDNGILKQAAVLQRLEAWALLSEYIKASPVTGHGLEITRELIFPDNRVFIGPTSDTILHPHNFVIQIWLETGLTGCVLAGLFLGSLMHWTFKRPDRERLLLFPLLMATLAVMYVGWGLWQGWWIGFITFLAYLARFSIAQAKPSTEHSGNPQIVQH